MLCDTSTLGRKITRMMIAQLYSLAWRANDLVSLTTFCHSASHTQTYSHTLCLPEHMRIFINEAHVFTQTCFIYSMRMTARVCNQPYTVQERPITGTPRPTRPSGPSLLTSPPLTTRRSKTELPWRGPTCYLRSRVDEIWDI